MTTFSPQWARRAPALRSIGALAATLIVAMWLLLFNAERGAPRDAAPARVSVWLTPPRVSATRTAPASPPGTQRRAARTERSVPRPPGGSVARADPRSADRAPDAPRIDADTFASEPAAASAPQAALDLSPRTLKAAAAASKGTVRRLAEASAQALETPRASKGEVLAAAMAESAVPHCLGSDPLKHDPPVIGGVGLGGLLALPWYVHAAATRKCKLDP